MVRKTKRVGFEPVFESLHSWSISYGGWNCQHGHPVLDGHLATLAAYGVYFLSVFLYSEFIANKYD